MHCSTSNDPIIEIFFKIQREWEYLLRPGGHPPVDVFTLLKYVPERWAPWKTVCRNIRSAHQKFYYDLLNRCLDRIANDKRNGSYMEYLLDNEAESGFDREGIWYA